MSVDFGPIPLPTSPLQTYFEEHFQLRSVDATAFSSRSAPVTSVERGSIAPQLINALKQLAEKQKLNDGDVLREEEGIESERVPESKALIRPDHNRRQSLGQRIVSSGLDFLSTVRRNKAVVQKVSL